jgi:uncharacterized ferredoxin-like protein
MNNVLMTLISQAANFGTPAIGLAQTTIEQQVKLAEVLGPDNYLKLMQLGVGQMGGVAEQALKLVDNRLPELMDLAREAIAVESKKADAYVLLCQAAERTLLEGNNVVDISADNVVRIGR